MQQRRSHAVMFSVIGAPSIGATRTVQGDEPPPARWGDVFGPVVLAPAVALVWTPPPALPVPLPPPVGWAASGFTPSGLA